MAHISYIGDRYVGTEAEKDLLTDVVNGSMFITTDTLTVYLRESATWVAVGAASLDDLINVSITAPADDQVIAYNSTTSTWENTSLSGVVSTLGELTNVNTTADTATDRDAIIWNNATSEWVNRAITEADISDLQAYVLPSNLADYQLRSEKNAANGYVGLNSLSKIEATYLPALAITEVFVVADITARDALVVGTGDGEVQEGDVAVVTDASGDVNVSSGSASYIYDGTGWQLLETPNITAPGANTQVIFNDNGDFGADTRLTFADGLFSLTGKFKLTEGTPALTTLTSGEGVYYTVTGNDGTNTYTRLMARIGDEDFIVATHIDGVV